MVGTVQQIRLMNSESTLNILVKSNMSCSELFSPFIETENIESIDKYLDLIKAKALEYSEKTPKKFPKLAVKYASKCVYDFVEQNWSSPTLDGAKEISQSFGIDGCNLLPFVKSPQLLLVSRAIFSAFDSIVNDNPIYILYYIRAIGLYQWLLDEPSVTLCNELERLTTSVRSNASFQEFLQEKCFEMPFYLECYQFLRICNSRTLANEFLDLASSVSGIEISFSAALGKRTKYQEESIAQLFIKVEAVKEHKDDAKKYTSIYNPVNHSLLPSITVVDDENYLNDVKFENSENQNFENLSQDNQALVLAKCINYADNLPKEDNLLKEEVAAFLSLLLKRPIDWAVQYTALYLRSTWDLSGNSSRKLDRSLRQLDHLISKEAYQFFNEIKGNSGDCQSDTDELKHKFKVFNVFFATLPPAPWKVERTLGELYSRVGATSSALQIFERLHSWTDVIHSYTRIGRRETAENIIRKQLAEKKTPEMLVYLGDCTSDPADYLEAWELSNHQCSKAQRNLGFLLAGKKDFAGAASCFENCLAINPLQNAVWFAYGCVGLVLENFSMAASGFYRCTQLDNDNGEAWANLATSYIKLNQKPRALTILQEAIRCQFDNWRLWENYLFITIDCGVFDEAIRSVHRLLDLREKFSDADVLEVISNAVCNNIKGASGEPCIKHRRALLELFARITATSSPGALVSRYHGNVVLAAEELKPEDVHKAITCYQRAVRINLQLPGSSWLDKNFEPIKNILFDSVKLHETFKKYADMEGAVEVDSLRTSLKYMLSQVASRVHLALRDVEPNNENKELLDSLKKHQEEIETVSKGYQ